MRKLFFIVVLSLLVLSGCDSRSSIPPTCAGTGTILFFREQNDNGNNIFDQSLSDYLAAHPDMKLVSQRSMGGQGTNALKMVIMQVDAGHAPPPVDDPSVMPLEKR